MSFGLQKGTKYVKHNNSDVKYELNVSSKSEPINRELKEMIQINLPDEKKKQLMTLLFLLKFLLIKNILNMIVKWVFVMNF